MSNELGPIYNVPLIETLPLGTGSMKQAMPSRQDLLQVQAVSPRTCAGYEVLLSHYLANRESLVKVFGFAYKMSKASDPVRARDGRDMLELFDQFGFKEET